MLSTILSLCLLPIVLSTPVERAATAPSATLDSGVVVGTTTSLPSSKITVNKFLGIPFAAPPVRFSPPVSPAKWSQPLDASTQKPACIQQFNYPAAAREFTIELFDNPGPPAGESEDCLYINVYAPAGGNGKTVMFWIYGGALQFGSNSVIEYDGTSFAANQDIIIVAPNYRTNAFGFLNAPELPLTERNLGFLDQRLALDWVQRNIHAFGGDPDKVTIFGESAGAASVDELVTTLPDKPPFRAAIMESGQTSFYINHNNSNHDSWNALVAGLNCSIATNQLACVRAAPALAIKSIIEHEALPFVPVSDNVTQLEFPEAARIAGDIARVPILTGTNANEGRVFVYGQNDTATYLAVLLTGVPQSLIDAIIAAYPIPSPYISNAFEQLAQIETEFGFQCPAARLANASLEAGIPTWRYYYNATFANLQVVPDLGVYHSSEIPLVFGTYPVVNATAEEMRLSEYMQNAWATFAKNPTGGPSWQQVPEVGVLGSVGDGLRYDVAAGKLDQRCALYDAIYAAEGI